MTTIMSENKMDYNKKDVSKQHSQILEAYLYILLESLNCGNTVKFQMKDLIHSEKCIMFSKYSDAGLTKRFHSYCTKKKLDPESISNIIPIYNAYSTRTIAHVLYNYPRMLSFGTCNNIVHIDQLSSTWTQDIDNIICLNARHYISVNKSMDTMKILPVIGDHLYNIRAPSITFERRSLNALKEVDSRLLKVAHKASRSMSCPSSFIIKSSDHEVLTKFKWCSLLYYELSQRVGDIFVPCTPIVTIDGYSHPVMKNSTRFSLGHLTNIFRSTKVENVRYFIGKGAQLYYIEGEVFLECLSDNAIFVQPLLYNIMSGLHPATVIKIPPGCNIKVFNEDDFIKTLKRYECEGYKMVYSLSPLCSIRISFVKGWGTEYSRQTVTSTPCWVEMHLNKPLKCLDECLRRLDSSNHICSSRS